MSLVALIGFGILINWASTGSAQSRPIQELPRDVFAWSTAWTEIPKSVYAVSQKQGAVKGFTLGSAKGTVAFVKWTAGELKEALWPDRKHRRPEGALRHYEF